MLAIKFKVPIEQILVHSNLKLKFLMIDFDDSAATFN